MNDGHPSPHAAALALATSALATSLPDLRAALLLPVDPGSLALQCGVGFPARALERAREVRVGAEKIAGGAVWEAPRPLQRALNLRAAVLVPLDCGNPQAGGLLVDAPRLRPRDLGTICSVAELLGQILRSRGSAPAAREGELSSTLLQLAAEIAGNPSLQDTLEHINQTVIATVACDRSSTLLWSRRRRSFVPASDVGTPAPLAAEFARHTYRTGNIPFEEKLKSGELAFFDRATQEPEARALVRALGLECMALVPLFSRDGALLGALTAGWEHPQEVGAEKLERLAGIARYAAVAIDSARLFEYYAKAAQFHEGLTQLSLAASATQKPGEIMVLVCRQLRELFGATWTWIAWREEDQLVVRHGAGEGAEAWVGATIPIAAASSPVARAYRDDAPLLLHTVTEAGDLLPAVQAGSLLAVPLAGRQTALGTLVLADARPYRFSQYAVRQARLAAIVAGAALENSALVEQLRETTAELARRSARLEQHSRALRASYRELEDFLFIASHDLRGPLINIEGFAHEIERAIGELEARGVRAVGPLREPARFVRQNVSRLSERIQALVALSDLATRPLRRRAIDVHALVCAVIAERSPELAARGIAPSVDALPIAYGDEDALRVVFWHLLDNAIRFTGNGQRREIRIEGNRALGGCQFSVTDSGCGMDQATVERAFRLFRCGPQQPEPRLGVGLTLAKKIVERHGGRIWIESQIGVGTAVHFTIPDHPDGFLLSPELGGKA